MSTIPVRGSRVRSIPDPGTPSTRHRVCARCGVEWTDNKYRYLPDAPCRDCREFLIKIEGHDYRDFIKPNRLPADKRKQLVA